MDVIIFCYIIRNLTTREVSCNKDLPWYKNYMGLCLEELMARLTTEIIPRYTNKISNDYLSYFSKFSPKISIALCIMNFVVHKQQSVIVTDISLFFKFLYVSIKGYVEKNKVNELLDETLLLDIKNIYSEKHTAIYVLSLVLNYLPLKSVFKLREVCKKCTFEYNYMKHCHLSDADIPVISKSALLPHQVQLYGKCVDFSLHDLKNFDNLMKFVDVVDKLHIANISQNKLLIDILKQPVNIAFDLDGYFPRLLSSDPKIFKRFCNTIQNISYNIHTLNLSNCELRNISFLKNVDVENVILDRNYVEDLSVFSHTCEDISKCTDKRCGTSVKFLSLAENPIENLSGLEKNTSITKLDVSNTDLEDISALENNKTIKFLDLSDAYGSDITVLSNASIEELWLGGTQANDCDICNISSLKILKLTQCEYNAIYNLKNLQKIIMTDSTANLSAIAHICGGVCNQLPCNKNLREVIIDYTDCYDLTVDLSVFKDSTISSLVVSNANIINMLDIAQNKCLKILDLFGSNIENILWLKDNKYLHTLLLGMCPLISIEGIQDTNVEVLDISSTEVKILEPIINSKVHILRVEYFSEKDISVLSTVERIMVIKTYDDIKFDKPNLVVQRETDSLCAKKYCESYGTEYKCCKRYCVDHAKDVELTRYCSIKKCVLYERFECETCFKIENIVCSKCAKSFCHNCRNHKCVDGKYVQYSEPPETKTPVCNTCDKPSCMYAPCCGKYMCEEHKVYVYDGCSSAGCSHAAQICEKCLDFLCENCNLKLCSEHNNEKYRYICKCARHEALSENLSAKDKKHKLNCNSAPCCGKCMCKKDVKLYDRCTAEGCYFEDELCEECIEYYQGVICNKCGLTLCVNHRDKKCKCSDESREKNSKCETKGCTKTASNLSSCGCIKLCREHYDDFGYETCFVKGCKEDFCEKCKNIFICEKCKFTLCSKHNSKKYRCKCSNSEDISDSTEDNICLEKGCTNITTKYTKCCYTDLCEEHLKKNKHYKCAFETEDCKNGCCDKCARNKLYDICEKCGLILCEYHATERRKCKCDEGFEDECSINYCGESVSTTTPCCNKPICADHYPEVVGLLCGIKTCKNHKVEICNSCILSKNSPGYLCTKCNLSLCAHHHKDPSKLCKCATQKMHLLFLARPWSGDFKHWFYILDVPHSKIKTTSLIEKCEVIFDMTYTSYLKAREIGGPAVLTDFSEEFAEEDTRYEYNIKKHRTQFASYDSKIEVVKKFLEKCKTHPKSKVLVDNFSYFKKNKW